MICSCGSVWAELNLHFGHANQKDIEENWRQWEMRQVHAISDPRDKEILIMQLNYM